MAKREGTGLFMKVIGIILIALQILSIRGGGIPAGNLAYYVGFFAPGIIGVILLMKANKKKQEDVEQN